MIWNNSQTKNAQQPQSWLTHVAYKERLVKNNNLEKIDNAPVEILISTWEVIYGVLEMTQNFPNVIRFVLDFLKYL